MPNRVAGGVSPPAPTTRVRTGCFTEKSDRSREDMDFHKKLNNSIIL